MAEIFIECPFCGEKRSNFACTDFRKIQNPGNHRYPVGSNYWMSAKCYVCSGVATLLFEAVPAEALLEADKKRGPQIGRCGRDLVRNGIPGWQVTLKGSFPDIERLDTPDYLDGAVARAFGDGNAAFRERRWSQATFSYGQALDFALQDFIDPAKRASSLTLGQKIGALRRENELPPSLIEYAEAANIDRVLGVHYHLEPEELETSAETSRHFTTLVLEYLFTFPKRVELVRERDGTIRARAEQMDGT